MVGHEYWSIVLLLGVEHRSGIESAIIFILGFYLGFVAGISMGVWLECHSLFLSFNV